MNVPLIHTPGSRVLSTACPYCGAAFLLIKSHVPWGEVSLTHCRHWRDLTTTSVTFEWCWWEHVLGGLVHAGRRLMWWLPLLLICGTAQAVELVGPKPFDAEAFGHKYRRETLSWTKAQIRELEGRYAMLVAAGEEDVDWFWIGVILTTDETVQVSGPGALLFGGVPDLGVLLPESFEAAEWTDSAVYPLHIDVTSDRGHIEKGQPIRLLVRVPRGTQPVPAVVNPNVWREVTR